MKLLKTLMLLCTVVCAGCAKHGTPRNGPSPEFSPFGSYSLVRAARRARERDGIDITLTFSGGGTRAAAFAYGVLTALRDTQLTRHDSGDSVRLLDEVDTISSVSGGSFTAAYYGLFGDRIFQDFEDEFLRRDVERDLLKAVLNPRGWFDGRGRTDDALAVYDKHIFKDATFEDLKRPDAPLILINATDIANGVRFSFLQEYFQMLCSDLDSYPVSHAVAASSAVPLVFQPILIENRTECNNTIPTWLKLAERRGRKRPQLADTVAGVRRYFDKDTHRFAHLVDGGVTDNLGLRAIYDLVEISGGPKRFLRFMQRDTPRRILVISLDASVPINSGISASSRLAGPATILNTMSGLQIHRSNSVT